jgi:hypothetical protein
MKAPFVAAVLGLAHLAAGQLDAIPDCAVRSPGVGHSNVELTLTLCRSHVLPRKPVAPTSVVAQA